MSIVTDSVDGEPRAARGSGGKSAAAARRRPSIASECPLFETSPDGVTWNQIDQMPTGLDPTRVRIEIGISVAAAGAATRGEFTIDDLDLPPCRWSVANLAVIRGPRRVMAPTRRRKAAPGLVSGLRPILE